MTTGFRAAVYHAVVMNSNFINCTTAINATATTGSLVVLDSQAVGAKTFVLTVPTTGPGYNIILENVVSSGNTVVAGSSVLRTGSVAKSWIRGNVVSTYDRFEWST